MPRLRITAGPRAGQFIEVLGEVSVGRSTADAMIEDAEISRRHVMFRVVPGALEVEDLDSANGTFVDGTRLEAPQQVGNGAQIRIGRTTLVVEEVVALQSTRISPAEGLDVTRASDIPEIAPDEIPQSAQPTRARQVVSDLPPQEATRARPVVAESELQATRARAVAPPAASPAPAPNSAAPPSAAPPPPRTPAPTGVAAARPFHLPDRRRRSGLASRSWVPPVVSYGSVVLVAIALVIYFASR